MKHQYSATCYCARCVRERGRRNQQRRRAGDRDNRRFPRRNDLEARLEWERRPAWGSQEWAETRGDDIPDGGDQ